jgi:hypothetical protein
MLAWIGETQVLLRNLKAQNSKAKNLKAKNLKATQGQPVVAL